MIASFIFLLLLATAVSGFQNHRWMTLTLFFLSWISIAMLFAHHATSKLDINL